ncbi:MAG: sugar phosphate nucleotidyltransferase [Armatimonadota bacterium]
MRPLTNVIPKELLPLGSKPVLHWMLDEIIAAGVQDVAVVTSPTKPIIQQYVESQSWPVRISFVHQLSPLGLGDAVRCARHFVGDEPFLVALGDCVVDGPQPGSAVRRLMEAATQHEHSCILCEEVSPDQVSRYGVLAPLDQSDPFHIGDVVEKPSPDSAPSNIVIAARYVLTADVFTFLDSTPLDQKGELQLAEAIARMVRSGLPCAAVRLLAGEHRFDMGAFPTYFRAFAVFAERDLAECNEVTR